ncbi:STAS domain-containing protein [Desulfonatronum thioautotrophicum]|uniref:STAS domain-containing protein n=1 Tax=Desulfonatronum thioautotrophicum TaxID=617001 RepID=UPI0005EB5175|nr:STAS domain-containing protein [Desulfonatronum thioautotrophicum]
MQFRTEHIGDVIVATLTCREVDAAGAEDLKTDLLAAAKESRKRMILDFSQVEFIDSTGLGAIIAVHKGCADGGRLVLCCIADTVASVFTLTRLDAFFTIRPNRDAAMHLFSQE